MKYRVQEKVSRSFACTPRRSLNKLSVLAIWIKKKKKNTQSESDGTVARHLKIEEERRGGEKKNISMNNQFSIIPDRILK